MTDKFLNKFLGVFVNSVCNKNCSRCLFDNDGNFTLTPDKFHYLGYVIKQLNINSIMFSGGEPLMYEYWKELFEYLKQFKLSFTLRTNGALLDGFTDYFDKFAIIEISEYPKWNDEVIAKYINRENFRVVPFKGFMNCRKELPKDKEESLRIYQNCDKGFWMKGDNLYECCTSEILERRFGIAGLSLTVEEGKVIDRSEFNTANGCSICWRGQEDYIQGQKTLKYKDYNTHE